MSLPSADLHPPPGAGDGHPGAAAGPVGLAGGQHRPPVEGDTHSPCGRHGLRPHLHTAGHR